MKFVANTDGASLETKVITGAQFDKVRAIVISKPAKFTIDGTSTTANLKLNYATQWGIAVSDYLLLEVNGNIAQYQVGAVTETSLGSLVTTNYRITGSTTSGDTYALDATRLPTVSNGSIASNVFTASANNASAQTFDYVASGVVESITPKMQYKPTILTVDPSSTTGNAKFNYSASGTVAVGSKLLVDVGGAVSEIAVAAGSQSAGNVFSDAASHSIFKGNNNFLTFQNGKLYVSQDYSNWQYQQSTLDSLSVTALHFYNESYYAGTNAGVIYASTDLTNWSIVATIAGLNIVNFAHDATKLLVAGLLSGNVVVYSSPDAVTWKSRYTYSGGGYRSVYSFFYSIDRFVLAVGSSSPKISTDGITWNSLSSSPSGDCFSIVWTGTTYLHVSSDAVAYMCIWKSATGSSWTRVLNLSNINAAAITLNNGMLFCYFTEGVSSQNYWISSDDGNNWALKSKGTPNGQAAATFLSQSASFYLANNASKIGVFNSTTGSETDVTPATYQFTMTSPSIAKPDWAALGGQQLQYFVGASSTSSFSSATLSYTRSGNVITATGAAVTVNGQHVQLKALSLNSGDILSQIGADIVAFVGSGGYRYEITSITPELDAVPTLAFNSSMKISTSVAASGSTNYVSDSVLSYQSDGINLTTTTLTRSVDGVDAKLKIEDISNTEEVSSITLDLYTGNFEKINSAAGNGVTSEVIQAGESRCLIPTANDWLVTKGG